jgi:hypothetical protein
MFSRGQRPSLSDFALCTHDVDGRSSNQTKRQSSWPTSNLESSFPPPQESFHLKFLRDLHITFGFLIRFPLFPPLAAIGAQSSSQPFHNAPNPRFAIHHSTVLNSSLYQSTTTVTSSYSPPVYPVDLQSVHFELQTTTSLRGNFSASKQFPHPSSNNKNTSRPCGQESRETIWQSEIRIRP